MKDDIINDNGDIIFDLACLLHVIGVVNRQNWDRCGLCILIRIQSLSNENDKFRAWIELSVEAGDDDNRFIPVSDVAQIIALFVTPSFQLNNSTVFS